MKSLTTLCILSIMLLFLSGCSFRNPFIPPSSTAAVYEHDTFPAEPIKTKAMYRATMKPYTVQGVRYCPIMPYVGQTFTGVASWYGPNFHGNQTSNGEYYDMHSATAAHKTLPINSRIKVTNLENGASTIVRINDRGPFVKNRIIDLSRQAAEEIGMIKKGTAPVKLEVLDFDKTAKQYCYTAPIQKAPAPVDVATPTDTKTVIYKLQIVSTQNRAKAEELVRKYAIIGGKYQASLKTKTFWQKTYYKVLIGDFKTVDEAEAFISSHYFDGAFIVKEYL